MANPIIPASSSNHRNPSSSFEKLKSELSLDLLTDNYRRSTMFSRERNTNENELDFLFGFPEQASTSTMSEPRDGVIAHDEEFDVSFLEQRGYRFVRKLADSLQGHVLLVESRDESKISKMSRFAIKRVSKTLCGQRMTLQSKDGLCEFVDEDILSEAVILQQLTMDNEFGHFAKFVEFFESSTHYFLVTEFIDGITLGEFAERAHELILCGKLSRQKWLKTVKRVMWQMTAAVNLLHSVYGCCHLDLCADNVMLENVEFLTQRDADGFISPSCLISPKIKVIFIDFGAAERFARSGSFQCSKSQISIVNGAYASPEAFEGAVYDARKADSWALGILMYRLVTNAAPFLAEDIWDEAHNGYAALKNGAIPFAKWLRANDLVPMLSKKAIAMLVSLLQFDADRRPLAAQAMQAQWFSAYRKANGATAARARHI